jgi:hypothetical protein
VGLGSNLVAMEGEDTSVLRMLVDLDQDLDPDRDRRRDKDAIISFADVAYGVLIK